MCLRMCSVCVCVVCVCVVCVFVSVRTYVCCVHVYVLPLCLSMCMCPYIEHVGVVVTGSALSFNNATCMMTCTVLQHINPLHF